jgi:hypothetical protein
MRKIAINYRGLLSGPILNVYRKKFREVGSVRAVNLDGQQTLEIRISGRHLDLF